MSLRAWLTLSLTDGIGPVLIRRLVAGCGSAEAAAVATNQTLKSIEGIGTTKARTIGESLSVAAERVDEELEKVAAADARVICLEDDEYPPLLRTIPDPPAVLYLRGYVEPRDLNSIAIVGSRKCGVYGREQAERFAALLAGAGFTVTSGGARGVDSVAHRGALTHPAGRTIAVLGSGIDIVYPPENKSLFDQIAARGAVMSEYAMGTPPVPENFPRRNRIVSGMSRGVLVVEADIKSGALITARQAIEDHGRPVFAIPGRIDNPLAAGPHQLIRDGAVLTETLDDIVNNLGPLPEDLDAPVLAEEVKDDGDSAELFGSAPAASTNDRSIARETLSDRQRAILDALSADPIDVETIIERTELPASVVMAELTLLTLRAVVKRVDGQRFVLAR